MRPQYLCVMACAVAEAAQMRLRVEVRSLLNPWSKPLVMDNYHDIPPATRLQWAVAISDHFLEASNRVYRDGLRDFDFLLMLNGTVQNLAEARPTDGWKQYPAAYEIPQAITKHMLLNKVDFSKEMMDFERAFDNHIGILKEAIARTELFALGCVLYELISGNGLHVEFRDPKDPWSGYDEIQARYTDGLFPDDVWTLREAMRILACWSPDFAKELLGMHDSILSRLERYIAKHPVIFGFQVLGSAVSLASVFSTPLLAAIGFGAAGPIAGGWAAGWQAGVGAIRAGTFFSWAQSAAMGGAAATGILAVGLTAGGAAGAATIAGALDSDNIEDTFPELKEMFLHAWKYEIEGKQAETNDEL